MAQRLDAVAIDIDDAEYDSCAVCTEPLEWVAVGWCGHSDVCLACAARLRFFLGDRRCCICRAHCPQVVVTKARGGEGASLFRGPPEVRDFGTLALLGAPRRGTFYWYHRGMAAFFRNWNQFIKARDQLCVGPPPPLPSPASTRGGRSVVVNVLDDHEPSQQPAAGANNVSLGAAAHRAPDPEPDEERGLGVMFIVMYLSVLGTLIYSSGLAFFGATDHLYQKVLVVLACAVIAAGLTVGMIWLWRHIRRTRPSRHA